MLEPRRSCQGAAWHVHAEFAFRLLAVYEEVMVWEWDSLSLALPVAELRRRCSAGPRSARLTSSRSAASSFQRRLHRHCLPGQRFVVFYSEICSFARGSVHIFDNEAFQSFS